MHNRQLLQLLWMCLLSSVALGCKPRFPDGVFRCELDAECPPGQSCSESRCTSSSTSPDMRFPDGGGSTPDSGPFAPDAGDRAGLDAGSDAAVIVDHDAGGLDAGSDASSGLPDAAPGGNTDCKTGFERIGSRCQDVDECATHTDGCTATPAASCINDPGAFHCECPTGYVGEGRGAEGCADVDECATSNHACDTTPSACLNTPGDYQCTCPAGYDGNGRGAQGCVDHNDCENNPCGTGASGCTDNGPNSYVCACARGYTGAGTQRCTDIDECSQSFTCDHVYHCDNRSPAYVCVGQFAEWRIPDDEAGSLTGTSYTMARDGSTILDNVTKLTWEARPPRPRRDCGSEPGCVYFTSCASERGCTWNEAVQYCEALNLAGESDWRLPTKIELESIVDYGHTSPSADPIFGQYSSYFWTSQRLPDRQGSSWLVYFSYGNTTAYTHENTWSLRCVRGGY